MPPGVVLLQLPYGLTLAQKSGALRVSFASYLRQDRLCELCEPFRRFDKMSMACVTSSGAIVQRLERLRRVISARNLSRGSLFASVIRDSIRQAKADMRNGASRPTVSMAPVLAITSLVARIWMFTVL
jgi:hypothetical protein